MADYIEDQFKTTLMGGYDKEDVQNQFRMLKDTAQAEKNKLILELEEKNKQIEEKEALIKAKSEEIDKLKKDISEKYQSYIDNYDTIGKIVYETRIEADKILKDAKDKKERMLAEADVSAKERLEKAQTEVEKTLSDGKRRYSVLQEEINELIMLVNQVQHKFMKSFKAIHEISNTMNDDPYGEIEADDNFDDDEV